MLADEELEGFFEDEDEEASPAAFGGSRSHSGLSMARQQQVDSSFFGFEDPGGAFSDDDDEEAAWKDDDELEGFSSPANGDGWLEDIDPGRTAGQQKAGRGGGGRAKAGSGSRRR